MGEKNSFGECEKFRDDANGSRLSKKQKKVIKAGGVAEYKKGNDDTKVFVMDEIGNMWSIIIQNLRLDALKEALEGVGYLLPAAWSASSTKKTWILTTLLLVFVCGKVVGIFSLL